MVGLHPSGAGHVATARLLTFFARMGTFYIRLMHFSRLVEDHGSVARGLAAALRAFLQLYHGSVVQAAGGGTAHGGHRTLRLTLPCPPQHQASATLCCA